MTSFVPGAVELVDSPFDPGRPAAAPFVHDRLLRSIRKLGRKAGLPVPHGDLEALRAGVESV